MRVCIVIDDIRYPLDEGFKNAISSIVFELRKLHEVLVVGKNIETELGQCLCRNRMLLGFRIWRTIRDFQPEKTIYLPMSSLTVGGVLRGKILKLYSHSCVVLVGFQPRTYGKLARHILPALKPDKLFVQSQRSLSKFKAMGMDGRVLPSGVDLSKFYPVGLPNRLGLRQKYGLPLSDKIILHVGHLNRSRGIDLLVGLVAKGILPVLVTSTSTDGDLAYLTELRQKGIHVITDYLADIQEIYQLADAYVFPTKQNSSAIEFPLSVLEALACGVPVLATRFGGLTSFFEDCLWFRFIDGLDDARKYLPELLEIEESDRRSMRTFVEEFFSWQAVSARLLVD